MSRRAREPSPTGEPDFSVVVPSRNRPGPIRELLSALGDQTYPADRFEVVVVDDAGVPLDAVAESFRSALRITLVRLSRAAGCAGARQAGVERARGRHLVFTDDDCVPGSGWLGAFDEARRAAPDAALGGPVRNGRQDSLLAEALQLVVNRFTAEENGGPDGPVYFPTNNIAFPRAGYLTVGGLDAEWRNAGGEDRDLCHRWAEAGRPMRLVPDAVVAHRPTLTVRGFARKFYGYGRGAVLHARRNGAPGRSRAARAWNALLLPVEPLRSYPPATGVPVSLLVALSQLCTLAGILVELVAGRGRRAGRRLSGHVGAGA